MIGTVDDLKIWDGVASPPASATASSSNATNTADKATDNSVGIRWESNSEINPWFQVEMSAAADKIPAAIALMTHANTTATQIKIRLSPDGSTWTDVRLVNVPLLTHGSYNYIRFNRPTVHHRYVQIYVTDGTAKVLAISEIRYLAPTESLWNWHHGHKKISATDAALALAGG